jgi:4-hydroxybenzoate polyprenyltransferase
MSELSLTNTSIVKQYLALTKPRVVMLITFCAVIGMALSTPAWMPLGVFLSATIGITLIAGAAAAVNCLVEQQIDAKMARTAWRPLPSGTLTTQQTLVFSGVLGGLGTFLLYAFVNPLTTWLTLATFVGYAIIYTVILKPLTPQNIVIGGASGAMPPVLGWAAITGLVSDHLCLDPAALLGARPVSHRRLRTVGTADAASDPWCTVHTTTHSSVHLLTGRYHRAAYADRYEWSDLSDLCATARGLLLVAYVETLPRLL